MRSAADIAPGARNARRALAAIGAIGAIAAFPPAVSLAAITATPPYSSVPARASLPAIERRVMCVTCKIPLIVAESPQADRERVFIRGLIAEGKTESEIESALVSQYGPTALGLPSAHGFDLTAYLVPLAAVVALVATLALLLPRWRRRTRVRPDSPPVPTLGAAERARLDADLARFDR
jgi:cytochrome c-type biogenesis protein CcmH